MTNPVALPDALLNPSAVEEILRTAVPLDWQLLGRPRDVCVERYWPVGADGLLVEWSFRTSGCERYRLFAMFSPGRRDADVPSTGHVAIDSGDSTDGCLRGVGVHLPDRALTIHSPDCDAKMPQLPACLDGSLMAERLQRLRGPGAAARPAAGETVVCTLLGYRTGRRAVVRYRVRNGSAEPRSLMGKTYRDDRGTGLICRHARVNDHLACGGRSPVRVPTPVAYIADLRMAVFAWAPGIPLDIANASDDRFAEVTVEALLAIHGTRMDGLPAFTAADECTIIQRWHGVVGRIDGRRATELAPLVAELLRTAPQISPSTACTIHRDFYPQQLLASAELVTVLDLDTLAVGSRCVDLGNFAAHLALSLLEREAPAAQIGRQTADLLGRYEAQSGPVDRRALSFYLSSALFRLGAVHAFRSETGRFAPALWELAADQLADGAFDEANWQARSEQRINAFRSPTS